MSELPEFDALWDFNDPAGTEAAFRSMLAEYAAAAPPLWRAELLTQIARTLGLQRRFDQADKVLDEVRSDAEGDPRVLSRWLLERGRVRNSSQRKGEATPLFLAAWQEAEKAGADYYAVDALHMLAIAAPAEEQMGWHRKAIERAAQSKEARARNWRASLLNNLGWTLHDAGQFEESLRTFQEALAAREEQGQEGPIRIAKWCVARCLRSLGRIEEALALQRSLKAELLAGGTSDGFVDEEIGECLLALGHADEAKPFFAEAHAALKDDPWLGNSEPGRLERLKRLAEGPSESASTLE